LSSLIQLTMRFVVDQEHRGIAAGAHALAFLQREAPIGSRLVETDTQPRLQVRRGGGSAGQRARQVGAYRQLVAADRLQVVHRVERGDLVDRDRRHVQVIGHEVHRFGREPAHLILRDRQCSHHRGLLLVRRILRDFAIDLLEGAWREHWYLLQRLLVGTHRLLIGQCRRTRCPVFR
jgi:hypothetical protein